MDILTPPHKLREAADLIVTDREGRALLVVEIKARAGASEEGIDQIRGSQCRLAVPYAMFADPAQIWLFGSASSDKLIGCFSTPETLLPYDPRFEKNRISHDYLQGLIEGWLADFTFSWRYSNPPHQLAFEQVGLAEQLKGGQIDVGRAAI